MATANDIQQLYVAYFNRPADVLGLQFWLDRANKNGIASVANEYANSTEYKTIYANKTAAEQVNAIYLNLFGRPAEAAGLVYWANKLLAGTETFGSIALTIAGAAQNADKVAIDSKVAASVAFTASLTDAAEIIGYSGDAANAVARTWLSNIKTAAQLEAATTAAALNAVSADAIAAHDGQTNVPTSHTLTAGVDLPVGGAGADVFNAVLALNPGTGVANVATLSSFDVIDGGAGNDTLNVFLTGASASNQTTATVKNVENVVFNVDASFDQNLNAWTGVTNVTVNQGDIASDSTITTTGATAVTVNGGTTVDIVDVSTVADDTGETLSTVTVKGASDNVTITGAAVSTVNLNGLTGTGKSVTVADVDANHNLALNLNNVTGTRTITDAEARAVTITASGAESKGITLTAAKATAVTINADEKLTLADVNLAAAKTITVTGDSLVTISAGTTLTALESISSAGSTGGITVTPALGVDVAFTGGAGKDTITVGATTQEIDMGAGDDTVTVTGALGTDGLIEGGDGTDTLSMTSAIAQTLSGTTAFKATVSGFEKVKLGAVANAATNTVNMANLDDISYVISAGSAGTGVAIGEQQTVAVTGAATGAVSFLGSVVATSANADTAAQTVTKIIADKVAIIAAWNTANPTKELADIQAGGSATEILLVYKDTEGNVAVVPAAASAGINFALSQETIPGNLTPVGTGALVLQNLASNGTLELTGVIGGASSVSVKGATTATDDVLNIKLNGSSNLVNTAALTVANVETFNITTADTTSASNPAAASKIMLAAADATTITVTGNHGVDFTGSTLTKVTSLDASGVVATGTAAGILAAGAVTFSTAVTDKEVTITGGNGSDTLKAESVNDATLIASGVTVATIDGGAGNDTIVGSAGKDVLNGGDGKDVITGGAEADTLSGGAGNDVFVFLASTDSTLAKMDVISDFEANTFGNGTDGAAGTGAGASASWTGDVLRFDVDTAVFTKVAVSVQTNSADAQVFLQNTGTATADTIAAALDSTTGKLYLDLNSDGTADTVIQLTGVTTITAAAFELV